MLTRDIVSACTIPSNEMKSSLSKIAESLSVSNMLKDACKPLNVSEMLSKAYQIPPVEDINNPPADESSSPVGFESTEEPMDDVDQ